jgi:hypothetical protein
VPGEPSRMANASVPILRQFLDVSDVPGVPLRVPGRSG